MKTTILKAALIAFTLTLSSAAIANCSAAMAEAIAAQKAANENLATALANPKDTVRLAAAQKAAKAASAEVFRLSLVCRGQ